MKFTDKVHSKYKVIIFKIIFRYMPVFNRVEFMYWLIVIQFIGLSLFLTNIKLIVLAVISIRSFSICNWSVIVSGQSLKVSGQSLYVPDQSS